MRVSFFLITYRYVIFTYKIKIVNYLTDNSYYYIIHSYYIMTVVGTLEILSLFFVVICVADYLGNQNVKTFFLIIKTVNIFVV